MPAVSVSADQEDSFSGWGSPGRNDTTSVVTLRPTAADDGAGFSCVAQHPAIAPQDQHKLNATIRLSVLRKYIPTQLSRSVHIRLTVSCRREIEERTVRASLTENSIAERDCCTRK